MYPFYANLAAASNDAMTDESLHSKDLEGSDLGLTQYLPGVTEGNHDSSHSE
jgi:hypothetical protein